MTTTSAANAGRDEFRGHLTTTRSTKGYAGRCGASWLWFDADANLGFATEQARRLCAGLVELYAIDDDAILIFFSGAKGFHVGLPLSLADSPPPRTRLRWLNVEPRTLQLRSIA